MTTKVSLKEFLQTAAAALDDTSTLQRSDQVDNESQQFFGKVENAFSLSRNISLPVDPAMVITRKGESSNSYAATERPKISPNESVTTMEEDNTLMQENRTEDNVEHNGEEFLKPEIFQLFGEIRSSKLGSFSWIKAKTDEDNSRKEEDAATKSFQAYSSYVASVPLLQAESQDQFLQVSEPDIVLSVSILNNDKIMSKAQEFLVLGSQPLSALFNKIHCLNELVYQRPNEKRIGFIFVENIFYVMMDERNIDYSKPILDWIESSEENKQKCGGDCKRENIDDFKFIDLNIRFDTPYLFTHLGNCTHIFKFTQARLYHTGTDNPNFHAYPIQVYQSRLKRKKCRICDLYSAKHVTVDDRLAPESPCHFCDNCYYALHYDVNGELIYSDFEVFKYFHE